MSWRKWFVDFYFGFTSLALVVVACLLISKFGVGMPEIFSNNQLAGIVVLINVACLLLPFWERVRKDVK